MNTTKYLFCLCFVNLIYIVCSKDPIVKIKHGLVKGHQVSVLNKSVYEFIGIRYAKPPISDLRFKKPIPAGSWSGIYDATKKKSVCWQPTTEFRIEEMNEDCLFLNVWSNGFKKLKPVFFWIHGGSFSIGSSFRTNLNGSALATFDVVVVTINYRLGALGFLYGASQDAPGNVGLYDQLLALKWVKQNIKHFGGDPRQITLSGESAGSISVGYHLLSDLSKGLFKRAIVMSGTPFYYKNYKGSNEKYLNLTKRFSNDLGCKTSDSLWIKCLKKQNASRLINDQLSGAFTQTIFDDELYTETALQTFQSGKFHSDVQILSGVMANEGTWFIWDYFPEIFGNPNSVVTKSELKLFIDILAIKMNFDSNNIYNFYIANKNESDQISLKQSFADIIGDLVLLCPTHYFALEFAKLKNFLTNKIYFYKFSYKLERHNNTNCPYDWMGYCHYEDVPILFGQAVFESEIFTQEDYQFSLLIMKLWTNFVKNGDPLVGYSLSNTNFNVNWPPFELHNQVMELSPKTFGKLLTKPYDERCHFWKPYFY